MKLYHGSYVKDLQKLGFDLDKGDIGTHLGTREQAISRGNAKNPFTGEETQWNIYGVEVDIKSSLRLSDLGGWHEADVLKAIDDADPSIFAGWPELNQPLRDAKMGFSPSDYLKTRQDIRKAMFSAGYDSIIYSNEHESSWSEAQSKELGELQKAIDKLVENHEDFTDEYYKLVGQRYELIASVKYDSYILLDPATQAKFVSLNGNELDEQGNIIPKKAPAKKAPFPGPPPWHWNCRSTLIPILKSFSELDPDDQRVIPMGKRSSMNGLVAGEMTYDDWFKTLPEAQQKEVLGKRKWELWKNGNLSMRDMIDQRGNPLTIEQLEKRI